MDYDFTYTDDNDNRINSQVISMTYLINMEYFVRSFDFYPH